MIYKIKEEDGFSLLEVILSIGIMAILSIFILQMFMVGARANLRAKNMDTASYIASGALEELKTCSEANGFLSTDFIIDTQVSFGLSDFIMINERMGFSAFDFTKGFTLYKYYDKSWRTVSLSAPAQEPDMPENENISFVLKLFMSLDSESAINGSLYNVEVSVTDLNRSGALPRKLVEFESKVYFANVGEMYGD